MKRAMVYILILTMAFSVLLSGCGEKKPGSSGADAAQQPKTTVQPETMMPDPDDGVVKDTDGKITEDDTGSIETDKNTGNSAQGNTIPAGTNDMDRGSVTAERNDRGTVQP